MRKKLIYILNCFSKTDTSHFNHVNNLLEVMAANGVEIALVIEKVDGIPVFSSSNINVYILGDSAPVLRFYELFKVLRKLIRSGFRHSYVRIAAPAALVATLAHRLYGGATYFWQSGTTHEYDAAQPLSYKKVKWYFSSYVPSTLARRYVAYFVTGPEFMVNYYDRVVGVKRDKILLLYNDIDLNRFLPHENKNTRKAEFLLTHGLAQDTLVLLLVHRLSPVRLTTRYFPSCLAHLQETNLLKRIVVVVAGDGDELNDITEEAETLGVSNHCIFLGGVPNREIQDLYAISDIFIHPTYNEGFPRVVIEAMASALPIVSTDAGGTRELVGPKQSDLIVDRDSPLEFSKCLARLINNPVLQSQLANENVNSVQRFSTENIAVMYEKVIFG